MFFKSTLGVVLTSMTEQCQVAEVFKEARNRIHVKDTTLTVDVFNHTLS